MAQWVRAIAGQARERELTCLAPVSKATVTPALGGMATGCLLRLAADVLLRGGACTCIPHTSPPPPHAQERSTDLDQYSIPVAVRAATASERNIRCALR